MDNAVVIAIIVAIIAPPLTVGLPLAIFQWRQNLAMENRLRTEIQSVKSDLEGDIQAVERRLTDRLNRTDDKVDRLIGEVGLVKGAILGVPNETSLREPATTS